VFTAIAVTWTIQAAAGLTIRAFPRTLGPLQSAAIQVNDVIHAFLRTIDYKPQTIRSTLRPSNITH
jgi:hypothetical protein